MIMRLQKHRDHRREPCLLEALAQVPDPRDAR